MNQRLCAEVERLRADLATEKYAWQNREREVERLRAERKDWSGTDVPALNIALTAARAEVERLRAEVAEAGRTAVNWHREFKQAEARMREVVEALAAVLDEVDDINGWKPTALSSKGVVYEQARAALAAAQPEEKP